MGDTPSFGVCGFGVFVGFGNEGVMISIFHNLRSIMGLMSQVISPILFSISYGVGLQITAVLALASSHILNTNVAHISVTPKCPCPRVVCLSRYPTPR